MNTGTNRRPHEVAVPVPEDRAPGRREEFGMLVAWVAVAFLLAVLMTDACTPPGRPTWRWHSLPPAYGHRLPRVKLPYLLAGAGSVLLLLAWFLAPAGYEGGIGALNLVAVLGLLWLAAVQIVRRKAAEEDLRRLQESLEQRVRERTAQLEAENQEFEVFGHLASHDLRAPLRAISGLTQILVEDHASQLAEEGRRVLADVDAEVRHMRRLIDDLLEYSRQGSRNVHLAETDMTGLVREVFEDLKGLTVNREVNLRLGILPQVQADPALLRHVWLNLLDNALKFTRDRQPAEIKIEGSNQGEESVYWIQDNGAGFEMQRADKLFQMFARLHDPSEFEGTGVGLALVQRIVSRHGGRVWAEAQVGRGATFYFTLLRSPSDSRSA